MSDPPKRSWDLFWFAPASVRRAVFLRSLLCLIAICYFLSAWNDATFWYASGGPFAPDTLSRFWTMAGLESEARWNVSPLFLAESGWIYQAYLGLSIAIALLVLAGVGGRLTCALLWLAIVGWANRAMILSGLTETALSLGLFACIFAPPAPAWILFRRVKEEEEEEHWSAGFAVRLLAVQVTLIAAITCATMLAGRVWLNGLGAYALAAPAPDRTIDWTTIGSPLIRTEIHESLTHLLVLALPIGLALAWNKRPRMVGIVVLVTWCLAIALLGSLWLYAATLAVMFLAIRRHHSPESADAS